ncbi:ATP-grasp domain-containing protein [Kitasatospora sp. NPDC059571]|uniref:ATP-grasp domain-containing protein n=1 Tax=Kitasatospora sp. NPDC059571 TaxID=3346871 RepID=UPI0036C874F5
MSEQPVVVVGFSLVALKSLAEFQPDATVIVIEEPDVVRKRDLLTQVGQLPVVRELVQWEYQLPGTADAFYNARPDLAPVAVAPLSDYGVPFAARLSERYGVPGAGFGAASLLRDKEQLRLVARAAGIANPESEPVASPDALRAFMAAHPGPVVLKPANRQAAVGVRVLHAADEVDEAWAECTVQDEGVFVPDRPMPLRMLAERCVVGPEFSVEMLVRDGVALFGNVTAKELYPGPRPVESGHVAPAGISPELTRAMLERTERLLQAVGFGSGITHCEWIVADGTPYLVECAGRFAGDAIIELIERAYGIDLVRSFWAVMKGQPLPAPLNGTAGQAAAIRFVVADPGEIEAVSGVEEALAVPGVVSAAVSFKPGDRTYELRCSWDRIGSAIACGATPGEAVDRAREAVGLIEVKVRPVA